MFVCISFNLHIWRYIFFVGESLHCATTTFTNQKEKALEIWRKRSKYFLRHQCFCSGRLIKISNLRKKQLKREIIFNLLLKLSSIQSNFQSIFWFKIHQPYRPPLPHSPFLDTLPLWSECLSSLFVFF